MQYLAGAVDRHLGPQRHDEQADDRQHGAERVDGRESRLQRPAGALRAAEAARRAAQARVGTIPIGIQARSVFAATPISKPRIAPTNPSLAAVTSQRGPPGLVERLLAGQPGLLCGRPQQRPQAASRRRRREPQPRT